MHTIDAYLKKLAEPQKAELERIRKIVKATVPDSEEGMSYGMPGFKYRKKYLIGFAAFKTHLSIFPTPGPIQALKQKLGQYDLAKGTIQFTLDMPLSESLIKEILQRRLAEIAK